jgi:small subunit ribosomal protein S11
MAKAKKEKKKNIAEGNVYIQATFNNTIVTVTDRMGNAISWASAGALGFKGAKKSTPFAAQSTAESAARKAKELGLAEAHVFVKGPGNGG